MTKRDELTRAVVEAAREAANQYAGRGGATVAALDALCAAFNALDALPAEAEGVEVVASVICNPQSGLLHISGAQSKNGEWVFSTKNAIATLRARVPLPRIPEVAADVVKGEDRT